MRHGRRRRAHEHSPRPVDLGWAAAAALLLLLPATQPVHEAEVRPSGGGFVAAVEELWQGEDGPLARVRVRVEVVAGAALAKHLLLAVRLLLLAGDEPGVRGTGAFGVDPVALLGLVPEHVALVLVAHALRLARVLVEPKEERVAARALRVPLVAHSRRRPIILKKCHFNELIRLMGSQIPEFPHLIVTGRAAALSPIALAGVLLEDDEFSERTGSSGADLVTLDGLPAVAAVGEVEVRARARVFNAGPDDGAAVADLAPPAAVLLSLGDDELLRAARTGSEGLVALAVLWPQHVVVLAHAGAGGAAQTEHLNESVYSETHTEMQGFQTTNTLCY